MDSAANLGGRIGLLLMGTRRKASVGWATNIDCQLRPDGQVGARSGLGGHHGP